MNINVLLSPLNADELYFKDKITIVVDVLRASTVITTALNNGAKEVIPVNNVEFGMKVSGDAFSGHSLIGGERNILKIDGFNLGNSPLEYNADSVSGKSIILFTTNGTKAIVKAKFSERVLICCFNNIKSVAKYVVEQGKDIEILCAGSNGMFCIEDTVCAGKLITEIKEANGGITISDAGKASLVLNKSFGRSINKMLKDSEHGKLLIENGFREDIEYCAQLNIIDSIPIFQSGVIKLYNSETSSKEQGENNKAK